jgi:hypothetical protein
VNISNFPVKPGETIFCGIMYLNHAAGYIVFANETTGQHFSKTLAPPQGANFIGNTAEWIMEAPDGGEPISSLPFFTPPVVFTNAICCGPDQTYGNPASASGNIFNIVGFGTTLTSVTTGQDTVTIDHVGPVGGGGGGLGTAGGGQGGPPTGPGHRPFVDPQPGPEPGP